MRTNYRPEDFKIPGWTRDNLHILTDHESNGQYEFIEKLYYSDKYFFPQLMLQALLLMIKIHADDNCRVGQIDNNHVGGNLQNVRQFVNNVDIEDKHFVPRKKFYEYKYIASDPVNKFAKMMRTEVKFIDFCYQECVPWRNKSAQALWSEDLLFNIIDSPLTTDCQIKTKERIVGNEHYKRISLNLNIPNTYT